jgi:hypothetical protein
MFGWVLTLDKYDLVARSPNDIYVLGADLLRHFDGTTWTDLAPPNIGRMKTKVVEAPDDIWVLGRLEPGRVGYRMHWNEAFGQLQPAPEALYVAQQNSLASKPWPSGAVAAHHC